MLVRQTTVAIAAAVLGVSDERLRWALERAECYPCGWFVSASAVELCYPTGAIVAAAEYLVKHGEYRPTILQRMVRFT